MDAKKLDALRHSSAHMLAAAVLKLYPGTKLAIGPTIENGFYYDFKFPEGVSISENDLPKIEKIMKKIAAGNHPFKRREVTVAEAREFEKEQPFKLELIDEFTKEAKDLTLYESGPFTDLCRGGHAETTGDIPLDGLKLEKVAGAYWRGSEKNLMLTRIYGLLFPSKEELEQHLALVEEAKRRDHRRVGVEQDLFFTDERVGKGLIMWTPNGTIIRQEVEKLAVEKERVGGYQRVRTPHLAKEEMYLTSGHLPYYKDSMYPAMAMDDGTYYLKAMNCPHHHTMYNHQPRSYRDLPLRFAEYGECFRNELSGTLAGLLRVREMAMNDAHIYCRKDQIENEFRKVLELIINYFDIFKLQNYWFRLSKWSPAHLDKYINEPENWEYAEGVIRKVLQEMKVQFVEAEDEAAFYGPKVDVQFKSIIGREETMSTVQLDFLAKERFGLHYTDDKGQENKEVFVIHRAPLSTHERFTAFLIEHYGGMWPVWLSPVQVVLAAVSEKHAAGARELAQELFALDIRVEVDDGDETLGNKVRKAVQKRVPYIVVIGDKELSGGDWMIRVRGKEKQEKMTKAEFVARLQKEISLRN